MVLVVVSAVSVLSLIGYTWKDLFQNDTSINMKKKRKTVCSSNSNRCLLIITLLKSLFDTVKAEWSYFFFFPRIIFFSNGYIVIWNRFFHLLYNMFKWWIEVTLAVGRFVRY